MPVTGRAGFIGSNYSNQVMSRYQGHEVTVIDGDFALSLIPPGSDASEFVEGGAVLFVGSFAALEEKPTFEMDGIALFNAQGD